MTSVFSLGKYEIVCHDGLYLVYFNLKEIKRFVDFNSLLKWYDKEVLVNG